MFFYLLDTNQIENAQNLGKDGYDPLHRAVSYNRPKIARLLVERYNFDINSLSASG